jgi:predicted DNA-binding protein
VDDRRLLCRLVIYMKPTTTIRVPSQTRDRLNALARRRGTPASEIVAELVREADERVLLTEAEEGWKRLAHDQTALTAYRAEAEELQSFGGPLPEY